MAAARAKTHIMRWAPQDYRTSRVRMRSAMTGDRDLRLVYLEALNALHEHGGRISSDPIVLSDELLLPPEIIERSLPVLFDIGVDCDGGLFDNGDGTISNRRVVNDLAEELEFRQQQTELGRRGGRAKAKAKAKRSLTDGQAKAQRSVSPPPPPPPPLPTPETTDLPAAGATGKALAPRETWVTPYADAWRERWGAESEPPVGEMLRPLAQARKAVGDAEALARWRRFLAAAETSQWARPARFAQGLGEWAEGAKRAGPRGQHGVTEGNVAEMRRFLAAAKGSGGER